MFIDGLLRVFADSSQAEAMVWEGRAFSYGWLHERVLEWQEKLRARSLPRGTVVAIEGDFSPNAVALFLALTEAGGVIVPLTTAVGPKRGEFLETAQCEELVSVASDDRVEIRPLGVIADHPLYRALRDRGHPGLVLFSSGSTGKSKAAVHDLVPMLEKYEHRRPSLRTLSFLLYDHIGGVNTMLHTLSNAGCLVTVKERTPDAVLAAVERHRVELLPTSPTFLNLVLISEAHRRHQLSSLRLITYGTEPMAESTLRRFHELFPQVRLQQTYGLSELGIMRTKSKSSDSLWLKLGGEGIETRVVDGLLQVKSRSAMLGYLNSPSPFGPDGWFPTGDIVDVEDGYFRIRGRQSEIINVGGEKVHPSEVESVVQEMSNVAEVTVYGEANPITGQIVCAGVRLLGPEEPHLLARRLKKHCRERLAAFKVPVKVVVVEDAQHGLRFKKQRQRS